ncbi:MAG: hypothetical protein ACYDDC_02065 [Thermoplasmataceae archaeon]
MNPDCGLRTRSIETSFKKIENMVKGTRMAEVKIS